MGEIISFVSGKGGVGKTTLCANIAFALASLGKNVIAIDGDLGLKNLDIILGLENKSVFDLFDILENRCAVNKAIIVHDVMKNLHFIPASQSASENDLDKSKFRKLCNYLREHYDYVLIDAPAGVGVGFLNCIYCCDRSIVVSTPDLTSIRDAQKAAMILAQNNKRANLIINKVRPSFMKRGFVQNIDEILDTVSIKLLGIVPDDENIIIYSNQKGIIIRSKSLSVPAFKNIAKRLSGEETKLYRFW